jgi:hypothetical protein
MFERTVSALVASLIAELARSGTPNDRSTEAAVTRFLLATYAAMPDYLRAPLRLLTLLFGVSGIATAGRGFHRLPQEARLRQIEAWRSSSVGFRRDLIKFFETLTVFGWFAEIHAGDYVASAEDVP